MALAAGSALAAGAERAPERDQAARTAETRGEAPEPTDTHLYLNGGVGYAGVDLNTLRASDNGDQFSAGLIPTRANGPGADLGLGVRLSTLTLGLRGDVIALHDDSAERSVGSLQLWSLDAELGARIPLGRLEPYLELAGGYSKFGGLSDAIAGVQRGLDIDGANLRLGLGLDYFVSRHVSLGARGSAGVLFLSRQSIPIRDLATPERVGTLSEAKARALEADGASVGTAYSVVVGPGLHF